MPNKWIEPPVELMNSERLAAACEVSVRTARRWIRTNRMPARYATAADVARGQGLRLVSKRWHGWIVTDDALTSPEGQSFTPGELRSYFLQLQLLRELQHQVAPGTQRELFGR